MWRTDAQNYDSKDRASIAASRGNNKIYSSSNLVTLFNFVGVLFYPENLFLLFSENIDFSILLKNCWVLHTGYFMQLFCFDQ